MGVLITRVCVRYVPHRCLVCGTAGCRTIIVVDTRSALYCAYPVLSKRQEEKSVSVADSSFSVPGFFGDVRIDRPCRFSVYLLFSCQRDDCLWWVVQVVTERRIVVSFILLRSSSAASDLAVTLTAATTSLNQQRQACPGERGQPEVSSFSVTIVRMPRGKITQFRLVSFSRSGCE